MLDREKTLNDHGLLDVLGLLSSNCESGRLQIEVGATRGAFFFKNGKLVDARLGSLTGFQAVNAAVSIREARLSFDGSIPPPTSSFQANERMLLKHLFGIETADPEAYQNPSVTTGVRRLKEVPLSDAIDQQKNCATKAQLAPDQIPALTNGEARSLEPTDGRITAEERRLAQTVSLVRTLDPGNETPAGSEKAEPPKYSLDAYPLVSDDAAPETETTVVRSNASRSKLREAFLWPRVPSLPSSNRSGVYLTILLLLMGGGAVALIQEWNQLASIPGNYQQRSYPARETDQRSDDGGASVRQLSDNSGQSIPQPNQFSPALSERVKQVRRESSSAQNLAGKWKILNIVENTSYKSFTNMEIGFRLVINQTGREFTARGEKVSENGRLLPASSRTPIHVTGSIDGDTVKATFVEEGMARKTTGHFLWRIDNAGAGLTGRFVSSAANASGTSAATKEL